MNSSPEYWFAALAAPVRSAKGMAVATPTFLIEGRTHALALPAGAPSKRHSLLIGDSVFY